MDTSRRMAELSLEDPSDPFKVDEIHSPVEVNRSLPLWTLLAVLW